MKISNLFIAIVLMFMTIQWNTGAVVLRVYDKEDEVKVESGIFDDDYLFLGKSLHFTGESEDLVFLGESLEYAGKTKLGVTAFGKTVSLAGNAENGIISAAKDIMIDSKIKGTNYLAGKNIHISKNSEIIGDVFTGCAELIIDGKLTGDLYTGAGKIVINNEINGNVKIYGGRLIISDSGKVNGDLFYSTKEKLTESELSRITGNIEYKKADKDKDFPFFKKPDLIKASFLFKLFFLISFLVVGLLILFIPVFKKLQIERTSKSFWYT
ncbi:MAG: polymer-forming cytoskeletal protein, partial [Chitinispirillia bacterium]